MHSSTISNSLQSVLLIVMTGILLFGFSGLKGDPPEDMNAWTSAPHGWHLDLLGPRTVGVGAYPTKLYVSVERGDGEIGDGGKERPYRTLQEALDDAEKIRGNGPVAILVASGVYREAPIRMIDGVHLYGGFDPRTWDRDIAAHQTVLDGEGERRVLIGANESTVDGFVIRGGYAIGHGGGLYCESVSPRVTNNRFHNNHAAEPKDYSHDPNRRRQRGNNGGAIGLVNFANPQIHHNLFYDNTTGVGYGAAISAKDDCLPQIGYNVFWNNRAGLADAALTRSSNGAAIGLLNASRPGIFHNLFVGNEALGGSDGGAVFCEYFSWPEVRWNVFLNNYSGDDGGALDSQKFSHPKISYNLFFGNRADGSGGSLHHDDGLMDLMNNIFAYNTAQTQAGAFGGSHGYIKAINNTVVYNRAVTKGGGAVHHYNKKNPYLKPVFFRNNIFHGNQPDELFLESGGDVHYNIVQGGHGDAYGAYRMDPKFKDNGMELEIVASRVDPERFRSRIRIKGEKLPEAGSLRTRVVRIIGELEVDPGVGDRGKIELDEGLAVVTTGDGTQGDQPQLAEKRRSWWSLITENGSDWIEVWGPFPAEGAGGRLEVIPTFHLSSDSPAINNGLYTDFAFDDIDGQPRYTPTIDFGADEYVPIEKP